MKLCKDKVHNYHTRNSMKYLVLGSNGMAGHLIALYLQENGNEVYGFARSESTFIKTIVGDASDFNTLERVILEGNFHAVINCIGILNNFAENDKLNAILMNSLLPHKLAYITRNMSTKIIHMSTDCVFSGEKGSYSENDFSDGKTFYDRTKALGELNDNKNITFRNSVVGPDIKETGIGLLNWFMKQNDVVNGYTKTIWTGITTLELAKAMDKAVKDNIFGLHNLVPEKSITKYELLVLFNKYFKNNKLNIIPVDGIISNKSLIRTNKSFDYYIPEYEVMIDELSKWIKLHKKLYPSYYTKCDFR